VSAFSQSKKRKQELTKVQLNISVDQVSDCPTRWGSMGKMVSRILQQKEAIRLALTTTSHLSPTWKDVDVLESIDKALSPVHELTDALCGEKYVTVSAVIPMIELTSSKILKVEPNGSQLTQSLKNLIKEDLS